MSDQCKHCSLCGDFERCEKEDCTVHEHWYVLELRLKLRAAREAVKMLKEDIEAHLSF